MEESRLSIGGQLNQTQIVGVQPMELGLRRSDDGELS